MYMAISIPMYCTIVVCKPDNYMYGISEKNSFKASFDEAFRYLNNNLANTFIRMNPNQGLEQAIETGLTFTSSLQQRSSNNLFLFTDLNKVTTGIIKEVLEFQTTRFQNAKIMHIDSTLDLHEKVRVHHEYSWRMLITWR